MHELSICRAIANTASDHAGSRRVSVVRLKIGHFRQVVPETLRFCWELHTRDSALAGCVLDVQYIPAVAHCNQCDAQTELVQPIVRCGTCNSSDASLVSGEEFLIESIDVHDHHPPIGDN